MTLRIPIRDLALIETNRLALKSMRRPTAKCLKTGPKES